MDSEVHAHPEADMEKYSEDGEPAGSTAGTDISEMNVSMGTSCKNMREIPVPAVTPIISAPVMTPIEGANEKTPNTESGCTFRIDHN